MYQIITIISLSLLLVPSMAFCGGKPRPPYYSDWTKPGATVLDVKKIILECGWPSPDPSNREIQRAEMTLNDQALTELCMMRSGFICQDKSWCHYQPDLPACQPGAGIPKPSVERRLNGRYCTIKRSFEGCVKNAAYPEKCIERDFCVIVPECLP